jgi:hypothetical protein
MATHNQIDLIEFPVISEDALKVTTAFLLMYSAGNIQIGVVTTAIRLIVVRIVALMPIAVHLCH